MPDSLDQLFADSHTLVRPDFNRRFKSLVAADSQAPRLAIERILRDCADTSVFLGAAVDALPSSEFAPLVNLAIQTLRENRNHVAAQSFVGYASLQTLSSFWPYLRELFDLQPDWTTYHAMFPWRGSGTLEFDFLANHAKQKASFGKSGLTKARRRAAIEALLETRDEHCLHFLATCLEANSFKSRLFDVGYELSGQGFRRLHSEIQFHLVFPPDYGEALEESFSQLPMEGLGWIPKYPEGPAFGGQGANECKVCHRLLANLLQFDEIPHGLGVTGINCLSIEVCISCLGTGLLYYQHGVDGGPDEIETPLRHSPEDECGHVILLPARVQLCPTPSRWRWQDWALASDRQNLNRLGGEPAWVQYADYPTCPQCRQAMSHLLQLGSNLPTESHGLWSWVDDGCLYVSWCDQCKVSAIQCQFT